jgi:alkanesulfonate monooxygenase SsuD/methylene tetrahydromethanopterin reductase-like flavin-dependent oxidoreductase (luciferase family)
VEFGIFHEFERAPGWSETDAFDQGLALADAAERWGLADTVERARAEPQDSVMRFFRQMAQQYAASAEGSPLRSEGARRLQNLTYDEVLRDKAIVGPPEEVVDRLHALREEIGLDGLLAELNCGGAIPRPAVERSLQLLCQRVMPQF